MTDVAFYHLEKSPLEAALPRLLEKTLKAGKRAVVMAGSEERVEALNVLLWTYGRDSWLPHGSAKDGNAEDHPVWLTALDENPNGAQYLFLTDGAASERMAEYERCFELFDGNDPAAVEAARGRWKGYAGAGFGLAYWQQTPSGGWERKE
ncbi:MAG: DNA polymerase III subunit chi [Proteobacteria bacterium]|nr:DNA polymerase III subunit chi [Pseudomonadota bacterium]